MAAKDRPLPRPSAWSKGFWDAAKSRRLVFQRCDDCGASIMYPKRYCPVCLGEELSWEQASGRGTVYTFTVQHEGAPTGFEDETPYVLAVVQLEEGVQLMTNIVGDDAGSTRCGDAVSVDFRAVSDDVVLPVFRRVPPPEEAD